MPTKSSISPLPFNPAILRWARTRAFLSEREAAKHLKVKPQQIMDWESRSASPTVRQARQLADLYDRPFLEFFAREIPDLPETQLVPDFRMIQGGHVTHDNKILRDVQAWGETQRLNAIDLFEMNGEAPPVFPQKLRAKVTDDPEKISASARDLIDFPINIQFSPRSNEKNNLVKIIRSKLEAVGTLVLKNGELVQCHARGLCIYNEILPIIILGNEAPTGSSFTLCHEFGHIVLGQSAVSDGMPKDRQQKNTIEQWCNRFAGAFLMPNNNVYAFINPSGTLPEIPDSELARLANKFAVSRHAMLVRLVQLNIVASDYYWEIKRPQFLAEEGKPKGGGIPAYYGVRYRNRYGDMYTSLVLDAWGNNRITNHNAAEFMGIKNITHLFDIRKHFNDR